MYFEIVGPITAIETIAAERGDPTALPPAPAVWSWSLA